MTKFPVGTRVVVIPLSAALADIRGERGVVEVVHTGILAGAMIVRLDRDGTTVGVGPEAVRKVLS